MAITKKDRRRKSDRPQFEHPQPEPSRREIREMVEFERRATMDYLLDFTNDIIDEYRGDKTKASQWVELPFKLNGCIFEIRLKQ